MPPACSYNKKPSILVHSASFTRIDALPARKKHITYLHVRENQASNEGIGFERRQNNVRPGQEQLVGLRSPRDQQDGIGLALQGMLVHISRGDIYILVCYRPP